jgi:hypothetical protein
MSPFTTYSQQRNNCVCHLFLKCIKTLKDVQNMYHTELRMCVGKTSGIMFISLVGGAVMCYHLCVITFHFKQCANRAVSCVNISSADTASLLFLISWA